MEKTNELNKLLSYIHMGNSIFRIYYENACEIKDQKLIELIKKTQETFKKHENNIINLINDNNEEATRSISAAGIMGIYKEKLKSFENTFIICKAAIKSTNMGMLSTIKFLKENENIKENIKSKIKQIINDYLIIQSNFTEFIIVNCIK